MISQGTIKAASAEALAQLRANARLRWGAWAILGILCLYGVLVMRDLAEDKARAYKATVNQVARLQGLSADKEWPARLEKASALQLELEGRLWRESTIGLAQASFNDWLSQAVLQAGVVKPVVSVAAQEDSVSFRKDEPVAGKEGIAGAPGLWKVSGKVSFDFDPKTAYPLMARFASHQKLIVMESLNVRGTPVARAELVVVAYFQKPLPRQEGGGGTTAGRGT